MVHDRVVIAFGKARQSEVSVSNWSEPSLNGVLPVLRAIALWNFERAHSVGVQRRHLGELALIEHGHFGPAAPAP